MILIFTKSDGGIYRAGSGITEPDVGVIGRNANPIDYGGECQAVRNREKSLMAAATGIESKNIIFLNQVHGDEIIIMDRYPGTDMFSAGEADGIITPLNNLCLTIRTADCVPVFAYDRDKKIMGAAHSGWRGTQLSISAKMVKKMKESFDSDPKNIQVFILPSIGPDSYTVNIDVARHFSGYIVEKENGICLNLWKHIEDSLSNAGIPAENIFNTGLCNYKKNDEYFSHRKGDLGRNLNFGYMKSQITDRLLRNP